MVNQNIYDVIIVGGGPAGLTAGIYTIRSQLKTLVLAGYSPGGQLMLTTLVDNFPGFPGGIQGPELMKRMNDQLVQLGGEVESRKVAKICKNNSLFEVITDQDIKYFAKSVILGMGADHRWLNVKGESKFIGKGVSTCAPCDAFFFRNKRVFVVGGGDSAMEETKVLSRFASEVILIHRRNQFRASKSGVEEITKISNVRIILDSEVVECDGENKLEKLVLSTNVRKYEDKTIKQLIFNLGGVELSRDSERVYWSVNTDGLFVAIGHTPNTFEFKELVEISDEGYIKSIRDGNLSKIELINGDQGNVEDYKNYFTMTSQEGIFVAGDVNDRYYKQAITAASMGCMAAIDCDKWLNSGSADGLSL